MAVLQEFKCPCCDGSIEFDSSTQNLKCPYCDTEFEINDIPQVEDNSAETVVRKSVMNAKTSEKCRMFVHFAIKII